MNHLYYYQIDTSSILLSVSFKFSIILKFTLIQSFQYNHYNFTLLLSLIITYSNLDYPIVSHKTIR